ncbi:unnamed protein product [Cyclocybe aegerita]|uniref:Uncharacterized protein n=1 Tax=Cyclocybe aegerita TaxID=1973307 RepID=A0A8S0WUN5_CYCAE|nr:unnamed protein product [Cyclocybe aegerita]
MFYGGTEKTTIPLTARRDVELHPTADDPVADDEVEDAEGDDGVKGEAAAQKGSKTDLPSAVLGIIKSILKGIRKGEDNRSVFTQNICNTVRQKYPSFNFVICHVKHSHKFDGSKGKVQGLGPLARRVRHQDRRMSLDAKSTGAALALSSTTETVVT